MKLLSEVYHNTFDELKLSVAAEQKIREACRQPPRSPQTKPITRAAFVAGLVGVGSMGVMFAMRTTAPLLRLNVAYAEHKNDAVLPLVFGAHGMMLMGASQALVAYLKLNLYTNWEHGSVQYRLASVPEIAYPYQTRPFARPGVVFIDGGNSRCELGDCVEMEAQSPQLDSLLLGVSVDPLWLAQNDELLGLYWEFIDVRNTVVDLQGEEEYVEALPYERRSHEVEHELTARLDRVLSDATACADWIARCFSLYLLGTAAVLSEVRLCIAAGMQQVIYAVDYSADLESMAYEAMHQCVLDSYHTTLNEMRGRGSRIFGLPFWDIPRVFDSWLEQTGYDMSPLFYIREVSRQ